MKRFRFKYSMRTLTPQRQICFVMQLTGIFFYVFTCSTCVSEQNLSSSPATIAEAAKVIDFRTAAVVPESSHVLRRNVSNVRYLTSGTVLSAFQWQRQQFLNKGWIELPASMVSERSASGVFAEAGFKVAISVTLSQNAQSARVTLQNLGNVDLAKLPVPPDWKMQSISPDVAKFVSSDSVAIIKSKISEPFLASGWSLYEWDVSSIRYNSYKQNAIRLRCVIEAAADGGTGIIFSSELMFADLPVPSHFSVHYNDEYTRLTFHTSRELQELASFYRDGLQRTGWQTSSKDPARSDRRMRLEFRNDHDEKVVVESYPLKGQNMVKLTLETATDRAQSSFELVDLLLARGQRGNFRKLDTGNKTITLLVNGTERTFRYAEQTQALELVGKTLDEKLRSFSIGNEVSYCLDLEDQRLIGHIMPARQPLD